MNTLRDPDLRAVLGFARDLDDAAGPAAVHDTVPRLLPGLVPCDRVTWTTIDMTAMRRIGLTDAVNGIARRRATSRERHAGAHQLCLSLPRGGDRTTAVALHRRRRDFADHEVALLRLLRPHLLAAMRRADEAERRTASGLTPPTWGPPSAPP